MLRAWRYDAEEQWHQSRSPLENVLAEGFELLRWSVLAASTIGPGTVIVCSKAGYQYAYRLLWALVLASFVAYALQEGSARLSIRGRTTLGGAMRKFMQRQICTSVAIGILVGNTAYQANNFVGAAEALYALGVPRHNPGIRVVIHLLLMLAILATLFLGDVDKVSAALGVVSILMIVVFGVAVGELGLNGSKLFLGLLPSTPPSGSAVVAVSLVATTAVPFNAFLASCSAKPPKASGERASQIAVSSMRRGVTLSTWIAAILSILIAATGAGVARRGDVDGSYSVETLVDALREAEGKGAVFAFGFGLYAAAFSSTLTVALGAALCLGSLLSDKDDNNWQPPFGKYARAVILGVNFAAFLVGASGAPTVPVVLVAQVVNGLLLPVVALCLVLCFESPKVISSPQPLLRSAALVFSFATTVFLAADGVLSKIADASVAINVAFALSILATVGVVALLWWMRKGRSKEQAEFELSCRELPVPNPLASQLGSPSLTRRAVVAENVAPAP